MRSERQSTWLLFPLRLVAALVIVVGLTFCLYKPDRPVAMIVPGSSAEPTFVVQIIRPRQGLPLGGLVSPRVFGLEAHLGFDSKSAEASTGRVGPEHIDLFADGWHVRLIVDADGRVSSATEVAFELTLADKLQSVVCRPEDPAVGTLRITRPAESSGYSGSFDIEIARCDAVPSGRPLGWPSAPLRLRGSFDRLQAHP